MNDDWDALYDKYSDRYAQEARGKQVIALLKEMSDAAEFMRWQFETPGWFAELDDQMRRARGWIASHCG